MHCKKKEPAFDLHAGYFSIALTSLFLSITIQCVIDIMNVFMWDLVTSTVKRFSVMLEL